MEEACTNLLPNVLCEYLYNLSEMFTRFYTNCQVYFHLFTSFSPGESYFLPELEKKFLTCSPSEFCFSYKLENNYTKHSKEMIFTAGSLYVEPIRWLDRPRRQADCCSAKRRRSWCDNALSCSELHQFTSCDWHFDIHFSYKLSFMVAVFVM